MELNLLNLYNRIRNNSVQTQPSMSPQRPPLLADGNYENLKPLSKDTVSFKGGQKPVKKSDFKGLDFATVEKYRIDISKFKSTDDLQDWAKAKVNDVIEKDYGGRQEETVVQRKALLKEWTEYVTKENDAYTPVMKLAILDAITKDLKPNTDTIPPSLNKGVLADTMSEVLDRLNKNPKDNININKLYQTKLAVASAPVDEDGKPKTDYTGWVAIPSKEHDPENFEANVDKLKALSHKNWCTKSFNAEPYLSKGDFHVYLENGQPKLGVRFVGDEIEEIQGEINNSKIPQKYFETAKQHIKDESLKLKQNATNEIEQAEIVKAEIEKIKKELGEDAIKNNDAKKILPYFGIDVEKNEDGLLTISEYRQPSEEYTFEDLGIDENKLFKSIVCIEGNAVFNNSQVTDLGQLQYIGGDADFKNSQVADLGQLQYIGGDAGFRNSQVSDLGQLQYIGGDAGFSYSKVQSLGQLNSIGRNVGFNSSKVQSLGQLVSIGGNADFNNSKVQSLEQLESIGGNADFCYSEITDLGRLRSIGGDAEFFVSKIQSLGQLQSIGGSAEFGFSQVTDLGQLQSIGGDATFGHSQVTNLGQLKSIGGNAFWGSSQVTDLGQLQSIGKDAFIEHSELKPEDFKNVEVKGAIRS